MKKPPEPASLRVPPPGRLEKLLTQAGFDVVLVVSRARRHPDGDDVMLPPVDTAFGPEDKKNLLALLRGYEVEDLGDQGEAYDPESNT